MPTQPEGAIIISARGQYKGSATIELLVEAGIVLASSLDLSTTMEQVARLTVPRAADLCVIDLRDEDGSIRDVAVAAELDGTARALEELRARHPLDPNGGHPAARVIRDGETLLLEEMTDELLTSFAQGSEHAKFMIEHHYRSAIVAPLVARERTLGALSVLRLADSEPYGEEDMDLVGELARRAALAIDNARLFAMVMRVEQRLEAILANLAEAITVTDEHGHTVFANQAAADLLGAPSPGALTSAEPGAIISRFLVLDEQGRELGLERMPSHRLFLGERPEPLLVRNIVRATEEERWLIVRSSPVLDPETKRMLYAVNVLENITEVKQAQLENTRIAQTLQRALLPHTLPEIPGAELAATYTAAGELNEVGGDFYDVFKHGENEWMLVIGDVCGKGPRAAGVTALARHTLRGAAMSGLGPAEMLTILHRALLDQPPGADLCTVGLAKLTPRPGGGRLTIALAGHPCPLVIDRDGRIEQVGEGGTLLGVIDPVSVTESEVDLHEGDTLLLYTDGVSEAGAPKKPLGENGLIELCAGAREMALDGLLAYIERVASARADGRSRDDIALLGLRLGSKDVR